MKLPTLPVFYYRNHFLEMLAAVSDIYRSVLSSEHHAFIAQFHSLSQDAQCLLIRMINRRGSIFNRDLFRYAEITDLKQALQELAACNLARMIDEGDYARFVACVSKQALVEAAKAAAFTDIRSSWAKQRLIEYFISSISFRTAYDYCGGDRFVALANTQPIEFLLYLYFGKTEVGLNNFTLRDLGIIRTNTAATFSARFADGNEALACFYYSQLLDRLEVRSVQTYQRACADILTGPDCPSDYASELCSRAAYKAGQFFERRGDRDLAEQLYRTGSSSECRERLARLLYASGHKASAEELLHRMIDDPASDDELLFATDFYARKFNGNRTGLCTELLRAGLSLVVDDTHRGNPEAGVAGVMRRQGHRVFFAENILWRSLFGILFWDELFDSGQLTSEFDRIPHCLRDRSFGRVFETEIDRKLAAVRTHAGLGLLLKTVAARWGQPNGLFAWGHVQIDAIRSLLSGPTAGSVAAILQLMCEDFGNTHDGFPDLMLVKDGAVSFLEVKSEGDAIRRNQLARLRQFVNSGLSAEIARVNYRFDTEQDYVVVDIETTGSWSSGDRITEIGAIKIRNHQVVDEWHSLLNPQRHIPSKIVQLTGITNDMVRQAPLFAEIADNFMKFMEDGIFVAHNVNFDYSFIASEYERLDRRFRFPKLCTVASMRRRFPGHRSYSLANLCAQYQIELDGHHRALCDARATAQLLNLVNRKRQDDDQSLEGRVDAAAAA